MIDNILEIGQNSNETMDKTDEDDEKTINLQSREIRKTGGRIVGGDETTEGQKSEFCHSIFLLGYKKLTK